MLAQFAAIFQRRQREEFAGDVLVAALLRQLVGDIERARQVLRHMHLAGAPSTLGKRSSSAPSSPCSFATLTPALANSGFRLPPCWSSSATSRCAGSIIWWSRPTASDWASARAFWKRLVSWSLRMAAILGAAHRPSMVGNLRRRMGNADAPRRPPAPPRGRSAVPATGCCGHPRGGAAGDQVGHGHIQQAGGGDRQRIGQGGPHGGEREVPDHATHHRAQRRDQVPARRPGPRDMPLFSRTAKLPTSLGTSCASTARPVMTPRLHVDQERRGDQHAIQRVVHGVAHQHHHAGRAIAGASRA